MSDREKVARLVAPYAKEFPGVPWAALEADILALLEQEPVAWRWKDAVDGAWRVSLLRPHEWAGRTIEPLYARPQPTEGGET